MKRKERKPASLQSEVAQSGGVNMGQENVISVAGDVIGTQIQQVIIPEHLPPALHQLEPPPADFTGREIELKELCEAIESGGAVISGLYGMGGVGKTALALKVAELLTTRYPDAQIYLNLRGTDPIPLSPEEALAHVVRAFLPQEKLPEGEQLKALYRSLLHGKRVLLLMDNARGAEQVQPLIPPAGSILLVTSRFHFTLPGLKGVDLDKLPEKDAKKLALAIAPRLGDLAEELCKLCDYLPLALRVSASALQVHADLPAADFLSRLRDTGERLKLTGVEASLRLSYDLLSDDLKQCWAALSVFPGSCDREAAAAVWEIEPDATHQALSDLLAYSLVEYSPASQRYELHDLARIFAAELIDKRRGTTLQQRHAAHYKQVLGAADDLYLQGGEAILGGLRLFDLEWENIQAGQAWAAANASHNRQAAELCKDYPGATYYVLDLRLHPHHMIEWLESALSAARQIGDRRREGNQLGNLGNAYLSLGEARRAIEYYQQALAIAREIGDRRGEGNRLGNLGNAYLSLGEARRAIEDYQQALAIDREIGNRRGEGNQLGNLGIAYMNLGEARRAIEYHEQALAIQREIGDRRGEGADLGNLGIAYFSLGEAQRAIEYYQQALAIDREIGDRRGEGADRGNLGIAYYELGEVSKSVDFIGQALAIAREIGDRVGESNRLSNLGEAFISLGKEWQAIDYCMKALDISQEIGDRRGEGNALKNLGLAYESLGNKGQTRVYWEKALEIFLQIESPEADKVRGQLEKLDKEGEKE